MSMRYGAHESRLPGKAGAWQQRRGCVVAGVSLSYSPGWRNNNTFWCKRKGSQSKQESGRPLCPNPLSDAVRAAACGNGMACRLCHFHQIRPGHMLRTSLNSRRSSVVRRRPMGYGRFRQRSEAQSKASWPHGDATPLQKPAKSSTRVHRSLRHVARVREAMELGSQAANHSFGVCCVCILYYII
jgi:hypothetical protein